MKVTRIMLEKFGYSPSCRKCLAMQRGDMSQPTLGHSEECRKRIMALARDTEEFMERAAAADWRKSMSS